MSHIIDELEKKGLFREDGGKCKYEDKGVCILKKEHKYKSKYWLCNETHNQRQCRNYERKDG